ncbi:hypothetical protein OG407_14030 [Streptomyces sp. NBC_01515]|uniref:hypothetical protein n=1 Tax=Streptomyces sp. NBC_01515 TaxID=2903890 RepID=UPI0038655CB8
MLRRRLLADRELSYHVADGAGIASVSVTVAVLVAATALTPARVTTVLARFPEMLYP